MPRIKQDFDRSLSLGWNNLKKVQECPLLPKGGITLTSPHTFLSQENLTSCLSQRNVIPELTFSNTMLSCCLNQHLSSTIRSHLYYFMLSLPWPPEAKRPVVITSPNKWLETNSEVNSSKAKKTLPSMSPSFNSVTAKKGFYTRPTIRMRFCDSGSSSMPQRLRKNRQLPLQAIHNALCH